MGSVLVNGSGKVITYDGSPLGTAAEGTHTVTWYDYDGTILKEETVAHGGTSTAPTVPSHQYLTFREWVHGNTIINVTQDYFNIARHAYLGDGLKIKVNVGADEEYTITVGIYKASTTDPVVFDWGDGTTDTHTESNRTAYMTHTYSSAFTGFISVYSSTGADIYRLDTNAALIEIGAEEYYCGSKFYFQNNPLIGKYNSYLKAVVLPDTLTEVPHYLFQSFMPKVLALPPTVTSLGTRYGGQIEDWQYFGMQLEAINIPSEVTIIKSDFLTGQTSLKYVTSTINASTIENSAFANCQNLAEELTFTNVTGLGGGVFRYCYKLKKVTFVQASFASLANSAGGFFYSCSSLEEVVLPSGMNTLTTIGPNAFDSCSNLKKINLPTSITSLGQSAFANCSNLKSISLSSLSSVGNGVFLRCYALETATLGGTFTTLGNSAGGFFGQCSSLKQVELPSSLSITTVGDSAFLDCTNLKTIVNFPKNATTVSSNAFSNCYSLTTPIEFTNITSLGSRVFFRCKKVPSIKLGGTFTALSQSGGGMFQECESATEITIPNTVTTFQSSAFYGCLALLAIPIPTALTTIQGSSISWVGSITSLTIPDTVTSIDNYFCYKARNLRSLYIGRNVTITNNSNWLTDCYNLREIDCSEGWIPNREFICQNYNIHPSSFETFFTHLGDNTGNTAVKINIGGANLNKLTAAQKQIATDKNYTLA